MNRLVSQVRFSVRILRKNYGLTAAVITTLMLGIGATTAIYTVVYATLLAPLPYPHSEQLVMVWSRVNGHRNGMSAGDFLDWQQQNRSFQQLAAWSDTSFNLATQSEPEQVNGRLTSPGWFSMQGIPFLMGRDFLPEEGVPGKDKVAVLTHRLWKHLGGNPNIIGQNVMVDGSPHTVVGVLSAGLPDRLGPDLAVPLAFRPDQINHDYHWLVTMGRLKPGVTIAQAQADMDNVTAHIAELYPTSNKGWGARVEPLKNNFLPRERIQSLWLLLGAVGFVLLITCVNIANLLLAKGVARQKEVAIRGSLGATRAQIFAQFLNESLVLALLGGVLGVGFGKLLLPVILSIVPEGILPSEANFQLDLPVLVVALVATTLAGLLFGCAPAWYASRVDPGESLKDGGRSGTSTGSQRLRRMLIVGEFGLALSLLAGAGLAIHSFWNLTRVDVGVRTDHVLTFRLDQPAQRFATPGQMLSYNQQMLEAIRSVPGVSSVASVTGEPLRHPSDGMPFTIVGGHNYDDGSRRPNAGFQSVSPDYYKTLGIQLLKGRTFTDQDSATGLRVAIVNQEFVDRYLKDKDPLATRILIEEIIPGVQKLGPPVEWQIVGVFQNVLYGDFREAYPEVDVPFAQSLSPSVAIALRTDHDPAEMSKTVAAAVHSVDSQVPLAHLRTLEDVKEESLGEDRFTMILFAGFAGLALLLAAVGIYGLMAFSVSQRAQEMGLRLALGASQLHVIKLILRDAAILAVIGLGLGLGGSVLVGRAMRSTLYGVGSMDFSVLLLVSIVLIVTALTASYVPARRAASTDPMRALRTE